jgi:hypothetical protein
MKKIYKADLVDAKETNVKHPDSFDYPADEIATLSVGQIVKVCNEYESF